MPPTNPVHVFLCYAPQDEELRAELEKHLTLLERQGYVRSWSARRLGAGAEWRGEIDRRLDEADVILLLVSADFLASDYLYDVEMKRALERRDAGQAHVYAILLRPCDFDARIMGPGAVLPRRAESAAAEPVTTWRDRDAAFASVAATIRAEIDKRPSLNPRPAHRPSAPGW